MGTLATVRHLLLGAATTLVSATAVACPWHDPANPDVHFFFAPEWVTNGLGTPQEGRAAVGTMAADLPERDFEQGAGPAPLPPGARPISRQEGLAITQQALARRFGLVVEGLPPSARTDAPGGEEPVLQADTIRPADDPGAAMETP
jgi:hypothetical protein